MGFQEGRAAEVQSDHRGLMDPPGLPDPEEAPARPDRAETEETPDLTDLQDPPDPQVTRNEPNKRYTKCDPWIFVEGFQALENLHSLSTHFTLRVSVAMSNRYPLTLANFYR